VRADTTVVAANVGYPTDAGLPGRAIGRLAATIGRIQAAGAATRTRVRDRRRSARRRAHQLAKTLRGRSEQAKQLVLRTTGELAELAVLAIGDAIRVARNAHRHLGRADEQASGKLVRLVEELETTITRTTTLIGQARIRMAGQTPDGATRLISLHDPMPARSSRAGSASRWSSATRPRSPTTPMGSCSITRSSSATPRTRPCWCPPSNGSASGLAASPRR
jgi:IS5 family transposase